MIRVSLMVLALVASTTLAAAEPKAYLQAGLVASWHPAGIPNHRVTPAISGGTLGVTAAGGVFVTPTVAVEGEFVAGGAISTQQRFSYDWFEDYTAQSRDVFLGVNVRWRPAAPRYLELVGGGGLVVSTFAERSIVRTELRGSPRPSPTTQPDQVDREAQLSVNGGVALRLPVSRMVEIVPAFTVRWIGRAGGLGEYLGVGGRAYQAGATLRFTLP
jgi:hypothetical protein